MLFLLLWFAVILVFSIIPVSGPKTDLPADKIVHFVLYGLTSILIFRRMVRTKTIRRSFYLSVALASIYGSAMEVIQYFLPYRSFSFGDMAANTLGAFLICLLYMKWKN